MAFLQLPDTINEFYMEHYGTTPLADMLTHLKQELIQVALRLIVGAAPPGSLWTKDG